MEMWRFHVSEQIRPEYIQKTLVPLWNCLMETPPLNRAHSNLHFHETSLEAHGHFYDTRPFSAGLQERRWRLRKQSAAALGLAGQVLSVMKVPQSRMGFFPRFRLRRPIIPGHPFTVRWLSTTRVLLCMYCLAPENAVLNRI